LIDKSYRNKRYATQCAFKLLEYAFEVAKVAKVERVYGGCDKDNLASYKVLSKIGMVNYKIRENGAPHFFIDKDIYEKLKFMRSK